MHPEALIECLKAMNTKLNCALQFASWQIVNDVRDQIGATLQQLIDEENHAVDAMFEADRARREELIELSADDLLG